MVGYAKLITGKPSSKCLCATLTQIMASILFLRRKDSAQPSHPTSIRFHEATATARKMVPTSNKKYTYIARGCGTLPIAIHYTEAGVGRAIVVVEF